MSVKNSELKIGIIGLGYVGLPLAVEFSKKYSVIGFDVKESRINELAAGHDSTNEVPSEELVGLTDLKFSHREDELRQCNIYIISVPTPVDRAKTPDLSTLLGATGLVAKYLTPGDFVVFESTVYPGCTEEDCLPVLEQGSGLKLNDDFFLGYSPERINPGDKERSLTKIVKVTSGSNDYAADFVDRLYSSIIDAGTYKASSIRVAEAAKVIENTQRDLNIALINELALIFDRLGIDTSEVLAAAKTKWNFLPFEPGLVGGHCIGVDPYYLTSVAQSAGYRPEIILAGRRLNDSMAEFISSKLVKTLASKNLLTSSTKVLILGLTFKEDCPDTRNTKVLEIARSLAEFGIEVSIFDPVCDREEGAHLAGELWVDELSEREFEGVVLAVPHSEFLEMGGESISKLGSDGSVIFDVKSRFPASCGFLRL